MKRVLVQISILLAMLAGVSTAQGQVSPVRVKVTKHQKSDYKTTYQSTYSGYREREGTKSVSYTIEVQAVAGGEPRDIVVKWAVLIKREMNGYYYQDGKRVYPNPLSVVEGEKTAKLEFGKAFSFDTDVVELQGRETSNGWSGRSEWGAKLVGYAVQVFINDQRAAADIQPADVLDKIEKTKGTGDQKSHQY